MKRFDKTDEDQKEELHRRFFKLGLYMQDLVQMIQKKDHFEIKFLFELRFTSSQN